MPRRVVPIVLALLAVALGAPTAHAAARTRLTVALPAAVPVKGTLLAAGRVKGSTRSVKLVLQQRRGKRWVARGGKHRLRSGTRRFTLRWRVAGKAGRTSFRVVALRGRRQAAKSPTRKITILPAATGSGARVALSAPTITAAPPAGAPGQIHATGDLAVAAGDVVAAGVAAATPNGYLGRVTAVRRDRSSTVLTVTPTTLIDAIPQGGFDMATARAASARSARALRRAADAGSQTVDRTVSCEASGTVSVSGSLSITPRLNLSAHWGGYSFSHPLGQLDTAALTASITAAAKLDAKATGTAGCTLERTRIAQTHLPTVTVVVLGLPVVLVPTIDWNVRAGARATAAIATDLHGSLTASAGVSYQRNVGFRPNGDVHSELGFDPPTVTASAHADAALEPVVRVLLYGVAGPSLNLSAGLAFDADATKNPWWRLTAPVKVTASLDVPDLKLHSGELSIYDHSFDIAHAAGGLPGPPVVPPPPDVPPPPPAAPHRQLLYWFQTDDLQCSLATVEDDHEAFFSVGPDDACGAFLVVDGELYGPATIPAGDDLGGYTPFTPISRAYDGDGTAASPNTLTTTVAAGDSGVTLTETDTWTDNGDHVDTTFAVAGGPGDTRAVRLYQAADCYVADDDFGTGRRDPATGAVGCVHDYGDGTLLTMTLAPLSGGASSSEKLFSDIWADVAGQGPLDDACTCATTLDNGFGLSWPLSLQGTTPVQARSRIALEGTTN